jgi:TIR domain
VSEILSRFTLPGEIERHLATLSLLYAQEAKRDLQAIIVNAHSRVHEQWSSDNLDGGTYGHALYLAVAEPLYLSAVRRKAEIQTQIQNDLNRIHHVPNEFIEEVFLELSVRDSDDWREKSGLLLAGARTVTPDAAKRIWGAEGYRVFLSHKADVKRETAELKERLRLFGVSSFVAHEDIHPTKAWQDEIESALSTMDAFVALMTANFHDSDWTDQEVGYAFARGVPIIAVRLGRNPYGFIGKFQGLASTWSAAAEEIVGILIKKERMFSAYVGAVRKCPNWNSGNVLAKALTGIDSLATSQVDALMAAYNETSELRGCFAFNGGNSRLYGPGLVHDMNRVGSQKFRFASDGLIEKMP